MKNLDLRILNKILPNLKCILLFNFSKCLKSNTKFFTNSCNTDTCKICHLVSRSNFYFLKNFFFISMRDFCDCQSKEAVYIIKCLLCDQYYIGQTGKSTETRIKQHLNAIRNFVPFLKYTSEIGHHFNLKGHEINKHFRFCVYCSHMLKLTYPVPDHTVPNRTEPDHTKPYKSVPDRTDPLKIYLRNE